MSLSDIPPDGRAPAPLDYGAVEPNRRAKTVLRTMILVAVLLVLVAVRMVLVHSGFWSGRDVDSNTIECASHMSQIGKGILMYANEHGGRFPDDQATVMVEEDIAPEEFICPDSAGSPAAGPTTQALVADFAKPGRLSYIYVGKGLTDQTATQKIVVLYEPLSNHGNAGMNVLFGDGHVQWLNASDAQSILKQAAQQVRPIRFPAQRPTR